MTDYSTRSIRRFGVCYGTLILISYLAPRIEGIALPTILSILGNSRWIMLGCLLVVPWRKIEAKVLWAVSFSLLICCVTIQTILHIRVCFREFPEGDPLLRISVPALIAIESIILYAQIPAIISIKKSSNMGVDAHD